MGFKYFARKPVYKIIFAFCVIPVIIIVLLLACSPAPLQPHGGPDLPLKIVTSIIPAGEFISKIGEGSVAVTVMVPQGADPHTYEPSPGQLKELSGSVIYAKLGSGLEFELSWLDRLVSVNPDIYMLDLSQGVEPIFGTEPADGHKNESSKSPDADENKDQNPESNSFKKGADPHIWLSPKNVKIISQNICTALSAIDNEGKESYNENLDNFNGELDELDRKIREVINRKANKKFIVYHPAWAYFAKDYGLLQVTVEEEGKEPTANRVASVIEIAKENGIKVIFASPQFNPKSAEVIAKEIGGTVVYIDPLASDYMKNMEIVLESLEKYLQ